MKLRPHAITQKRERVKPRVRRLMIMLNPLIVLMLRYETPHHCEIQRSHVLLLQHHNNLHAIPFLFAFYPVASSLTSRSVFWRLLPYMEHKQEV